MYRADPDAAVQALSLGYLSVALNPRQGLAGGNRLANGRPPVDDEYAQMHPPAYPTGY